MRNVTQENVAELYNISTLSEAEDLQEMCLQLMIHNIHDFADQLYQKEEDELYDSEEEIKNESPFKNIIIGNKTENPKAGQSLFKAVTPAENVKKNDDSLLTNMKIGELFGEGITISGNSEDVRTDEKAPEEKSTQFLFKDEANLFGNTKDSKLDSFQSLFSSQTTQRNVSEEEKQGGPILKGGVDLFGNAMEQKTGESLLKDKKELKAGDFLFNSSQKGQKIERYIWNKGKKENKNDLLESQTSVEKSEDSRENQRPKDSSITKADSSRTKADSSSISNI